MFQSARIKLTAWYLLIIMLISIAFSVAIYEVLTSELDRVERIQRLRQERQIPMEITPRIPRQPAIDPEVIMETKNRLIEILILINMGILGVSAISGYFLAGRTLRQIKEMVDEQSRFITDASHELRTPLTSLKSEIEVNLRDEDLDLKQAKKILQSNLEEVNNLQYLSDNLIKFTQYQNKEKPNFAEVNLREISEEAKRKVSNLAKKKNIIIKNQIKNLSLKGDRQSLLELFVIFLDNAIKYSPKEKTVILTSKKIDGLVEIQIIDQGIGIDAGDIPYLFNRFFRVDKSRLRLETGGYGLGLSIAKQIVDEHKGSIKVDSQLDKGTTFFVQLPF